MSGKDIRWNQRFEHLELAFGQLAEAISNHDTLNRLEQEGLVKRFEYTFELAWKTLKDYLEAQGVSAKFPREVIKSAFELEILDDGEIWLEMLEKRNLLVHIYNEDRFVSIYNDIVERYFEVLEKLVVWLKTTK